MKEGALYDIRTGAEIPIVYTGAVRAKEACVFGATLYDKGDVFAVTNHKVLESDPFEPVRVIDWDDLPPGRPGGNARVGDGVAKHRARCEVLSLDELQALSDSRESHRAEPPNDLAALFEEMVSEECHGLAAELRGYGVTFDPAELYSMVCERRIACESGHFAVSQFPSGSVGPVWVPSPWEAFYRVRELRRALSEGRT